MNQNFTARSTSTPSTRHLLDGVAMPVHPTPWLISTQVVSNRSFAKLAALAPDAVLLSGDLSYADGWPWRWDSRGRGVPPSSN